MTETKKFIFGSLNYMLPFCPIGRSELFPCESTFHRKAFIIGVRCFKESFISQDRNEHQAFQRRWSWGHIFERSNKPTPEASILQKVQILLLPIKKKQGALKIHFRRFQGEFWWYKKLWVWVFEVTAPLPWVHSITTSLDKNNKRTTTSLRYITCFHISFSTLLFWFHAKNPFNHNVCFGKEDFFATTGNNV